MTILTNDFILEKMKQELPAGFKNLQLFVWEINEEGQVDIYFRCEIDLQAFIEKKQQYLIGIGYSYGLLERFQKGLKEAAKLTGEKLTVVSDTSYKKHTVFETESYTKEWILNFLYEEIQYQLIYLELLKWMKIKVEKEIKAFRATIETWMEEILTPSNTFNTNTPETGERSVKTMTNKPTFQLTDLESREKLHEWMDLHLESIDLNTLLEQLEKEGDLLENISPFYFEVGDEVIHMETYLTGEILEIHGERATVELPNGQIKQWDLSELDMKNRLVDLPVCGTIWKPSEEMACFIQKNMEAIRYEAGFHIYRDQQDQLYLGINGYGYSFLTYHFKPLFELFLDDLHQ